MCSLVLNNHKVRNENMEPTTLKYQMRMELKIQEWLLCAKGAPTYVFQGSMVSANNVYNSVK